MMTRQEPPESNRSTTRAACERLRDLLGLQTAPVAVYLVPQDADAAPFEGWTRVRKHRYCQLLMRARHGEAGVLEPDELACPAAAAAFGLRPLPEKLVCGKGLVGFGITAEDDTGRRMFEDMPRLPAGSVSFIAAAPLCEAPHLPDVVVVEGPPEPLMWLLLADLNLAGGERRRASTAVLQATCVDSTVIPLSEQRLNFGLGCYGCRDATDLGQNETVVGFPGSLLEPLADMVQYLGRRAIPRARAKGVFHGLQGRAGERAGYAGGLGS